MEEENNEFNLLHGEVLRNILTQLTICIIVNSDKSAEQKRALDFAIKKNEDLKKDLDDHIKYIADLKKCILEMTEAVLENAELEKMLEELKKENNELMKKVKHD